MKLTRRIFTLFLVLVMFISSMSVTAFAAGDVKYGIGFTTGTNLRLRSSASTSSKILDTAEKKGEVVVVVSKVGEWYKVIYNLQEGYMHGDYVDAAKTENAELGYGKVNGTSVNIRSGAGTSYSKVAVANKNDKVYIIGISNGWYQVICGSTIGYIRSDYVDLTEIPYENKDSAKSPIFFRGGKSTGVSVSAEALNGTSTEESTGTSTEESTGTSTEESTGTSENTSTGSEVSNATVADGVKYGIGFTTSTNLRLRSSASTGSKILDVAEKKGEVVVLVSKVGDWYKVIYNLQEGYMHSDYIDAATMENAELGYGKVNGTSVNMRSGAGTGHSKVAVTGKNDKVYIIGISNGWYKVIYGSKIGYIRSDYVDLTEIPYENLDSAKSPIFFRGGKSTGVNVSAAALNGTSGSADTSSKVTGADIVATAKKYLGTPYKYGGKSPSGFDCSGFVYYVYRSLGINISRTQATMYKQGTPVSKSELKPGDLVFFQNTYKVGISHVGIYVGNGQFIHSPSSGKVVSYADLNSKYYVNHYYGAVRYTK